MLATTAGPLKTGIFGAAVAGPVLALQILSHPVLRRLYRLILYDRSPNPADFNAKERRQSAGAAVGLFPNGLYLLYQLGLRNALLKAGRESLGASFWRAGYDGDYKHLGTMRKTGWADDLESHVLAIERSSLQAVLLKRLSEVEGEVHWNTGLRSIEQLPNGTTMIAFDDGKSEEVDLLVGADGAFSQVRKHILMLRNAATAQDRRLPDFFGAAGVYGISASGPSVTDDASQTHAMWLESGNISTSPLPNRRLRWNLQIPEAGSPAIPPALQQRHKAMELESSTEWEATIAAGIYPRPYTTQILREHFDVYHPTAGSFGALLKTSDRIIHTPLRQRVWSEDEIQCGNVVLIGDASRTLLPSSGQGTGFSIEDATVLAAA